MSKIKKYITAATTFSVALGIGFVMQYGDAVAARLGADRPVSGPNTQAAPVPEVVPVSASTMVPTSLPLPAQPVATPIVPVAATDIPTEIDTPVFDLSEKPLQADIAPLADETAPVAEAPLDTASTCSVSVGAQTTDLAMVTMTVDSPCHYNMIATFHHEGMMFHGILDDAGALSIDVPALDQDAFFVVSFEDGMGGAAQASVPDLGMYDRAVLQWEGTEDVQLHALEFGATYGDDGHIWAATAADTDRAIVGEGGFLTRLGHEAVPGARMVEIYTFPSGMAAREGDVVLNVEAEVTARNCGRSIAAQSIQTNPLTDPSIMDLTMAMPDCDAIGEYLVLKNMFEDLTLAAK